MVINSMMAVIASGAALFLSGAGSIDVRRDYGDRLVVMASVNGAAPVDFLIDTGASTHVVFDNIRTRVDLPEPVGTAAVISFAGLKAAPRVKLNSLEVGRRRAENVSAVLLEDWAEQARTPQGLIGLDFFEGQVVVIDRAKGEIRGYGRGEAPDELRRWRAAPLRHETFGIVREPLLLTSIIIDGVSAEALIDTGASASVCNVAAISKLTTVPPIREILQEVADANGGVIRSYEVSTSRLEIGAKDFGEATVLVSDAPFFRSIGYAEKPFCVLGLDFLSETAFAIDYANRRLLFDPGRRN